MAVARGPGRRCPHTGAGLTAGRAWGREPAVPPVVCDATGGDARGRGHRVRTTERAVGVAPPTKGRAVARAVGPGATTDPLDAQIVAPDGEVCARPVEAAQEEAREAGRARRGRRPPLLAHRPQKLTRLEKGVRGRGTPSCQRQLAWVDKEPKPREDESQHARQARPAVAARAAVSQRVGGVGVLTAAPWLASVPEWGHGSGKALTALVGVGPWAPDSGPHRGDRAIRGGRGRRAFDLAALSVSRTHTDLGRV